MKSRLYLELNKIKIWEKRRTRSPIYIHQLLRSFRGGGFSRTHAIPEIVENFEPDSVPRRRPWRGGSASQPVSPRPKARESGRGKGKRKRLVIRARAQVSAKIPPSFIVGI
ncbi:hypothetical protein IF2G_03381 [Cordyceps javanica]|nr:hypothetical protein IF2G_03381 [Cordyceps javanica]